MTADVTNLRSAAAPRSDQTNFDDVNGTQKTITVTSVRSGNAEQPVVINYEGDNGKPYKPCKSMLRVLIYAWGEDGREWAGKSMTIYGDPEVKFGGVKVGGIRISHLSHIKEPIDISLTVTRGKRAPYKIQPLKVAREPQQPPMYPTEKYEANKPKWQELVTSGKKTPEQIIAQVQKSGQLTDEQLTEIRGWTVAEPEPAGEDDDELFDD